MKSLAIGALALAAWAAGGPASAQYRPDRIGQACAGVIWATSEQRLKICGGMIEDASRTPQARAFAYANRAGAYYELRRLEPALADADKAVALWPEYNQAYIIRGTILADLGRSQAAIEDLDKAIAGRGSYPAYLARGHLRFLDGDLSAAKADFDLALKYAPTSPSALMGRGNADNALGLYAEADKDFSTAVRFAPWEPRLWGGRAQARLGRGDVEGAAADVQRGVEAATKPPAGLSTSAPPPTPAEAAGRLWLTIGKGLSDRGDYANGLTALDRAVAATPVAVAYNARCWHRATIGRDLAAGRADCDRALELAPGDPSVLDSLGLLKFRGGDLAGALSDLDAALRRRPRSPGTLYFRGVVKKKLGSEAAGEADMTAALAMQPNVKQAFARYKVET